MCLELVIDSITQSRPKCFMKLFAVLSILSFGASCPPFAGATSRRSASQGIPLRREHRRSGIGALLAVGVLLAGPNAGRLRAVENDQSLASRITSSVVLYQPFMCARTAPASESENQVFWNAVEQIPKRGLGACELDLEDFLRKHPDSPWAASLRVNLGLYYADHARYHRAIEHWQAAWSAAKTLDGPGKQVADFALAHCVRLLAGLGDLNTAAALFLEADGRDFENAQLKRLVASSHNACEKMTKSTDSSFRCGAYALNHVANALQLPGVDQSKLRGEPSPSTGFSMAKLLEMAQRAGLDLEAVQCEQGAALIVPCVVHWKDQHYAAIVAGQGGFYEVVDTVLKNPRWISAQDILDEASGAFLVPRSKIAAGWKPMAVAEINELYGRGQMDGDSSEYDSCSNGSGGRAGGPGGGPGSNKGGPGGQPVHGGGINNGPGSVTANDATQPSCGAVCGNSGDSQNSGTGGGGVGPCNPPCPGSDSGSSAAGGNAGGQSFRPLAGASGMPVWEVSEPYIDLWLYDEPLAYQPGLGPRVSFQLTYKQLDATPVSPVIFGLGPFWNCSWLSYVEDDGPTATLLLPGGGERIYTPTGLTDEYFSNSRMLRLTNAQGLIGFVVTNVSGAQDFYEYIPTNQVIHTNVFLSAKVDPAGNATHFYYQEATSSLKLLYVVDGDGRTNTLSYGNSSVPNQITGVSDPFGNTVALQYGSANQWLTNVTDPVAISSSFAYDSYGNLTNLVTPYGTTRFETFDNDGNWGYSDNPVMAQSFLRGIRVTDAAGGTNVYVLEQDAGLTYGLDSFMGVVGDWIYNTWISGTLPSIAMPIPTPDLGYFRPTATAFTGVRSRLGPADEFE